MLNSIKNHIEHIQIYITTAQNGINDANILTKNEIDYYNINIEKIKYLRTAIFEKERELIFVIKVPKIFFNIQVITIIPIPYLNKEINAEISNVFKYNDKIYEYKKNKYINECTISKHCTIDKTCELITNVNSEIININDEIIIVKNAKNYLIQNNCGSEALQLNGNYVIKYNNCSIELANQKFSNNYKMFIDKIISNNITFNTTLTLEELKLTSIHNLKEIEEIKYKNKIVTYSTPTVVILIVILFVIILMCNHCKRNKKRIQENPSSRGGGVTYIVPQTTICNENSNVDEIIRKYLNQPNNITV
uniref:Uncharacterized protein n=1 Tax=Bactrocera dorsalis TaxID=27457 RepID=A0A034VS88_BACDO